MLISELDKYICIATNFILYTTRELKFSELGETKHASYRIDEENKEIKLYDMQNLLTFQEKSIIYEAFLDKYYFYPLARDVRRFRELKFENFVIKENGHTYHELYQLDGAGKGILGELIFEIPRQEKETARLSQIRDIYEILTKNIHLIGNEEVSIKFSSKDYDLENLYQVTLYMFDYDERLSKLKDKCIVKKKAGILGTKNCIKVIPK